MDNKTTRLIIALAWITILAVAGAKFYVVQRDNHIKAMGEACVHHIHNLSASANANLSDVYSFNSPKDAQNYEWQALAQCSVNYPFFSNNSSNTFNLSLKTLDVSYNNMTGMPAEIGQLNKLQTLNYSYNNITGLPNELANLKNTLKEFNLTGNPISPSTLSKLKSELPNTTIIF